MLSKDDAARLRIKARHGQLTADEQAMLDEYEATNASSGQKWSPEPVAAPGVHMDSGSFGWAVLGFFFPLVGLVLWLVWHDGKPLSAKRAGKGAIVGFITGLVLAVLLFIAIFFFAGSLIQTLPADTWRSVPDMDFDGSFQYGMAMLAGMLA